MVQTQLFFTLVPWAWVVAMPDMASVVQEVTRISLIPNMPLFGASQGPRMVQVQLYLSLVPWSLALVLPDMASVVQDVTRISLVPNMEYG